MTDFRGLIAALVEGGVEFIVIGGAAATVHGSSRLTQDLDVSYRRTPENHRRLARSLAPLRPYLRGAPPGLPFVFDEAALRMGVNFTLITSLGELDLLGEIAGGGAYDDLLRRSVEITIYGHVVRCLDLPTLIFTKRAAGRPKDLEHIAELERILGERSGG